MIEALHEEDPKFVAGWDNPKIAKWIEEHPCERVEWVHPSWDRHI